MKRGELWIARADLYATKARPVLVIQSDNYTYDSVITCLVTTYERSNDRFRIRIAPDAQNGLREVSYLMFDKIFSFAREDLAVRIGLLSPGDMQAIDEKLKMILGLE
jgi:mRNA interferase MazF